MSNYLCITIRFADPTFRGRSDGGEAEWPPSPLRVFQALVAACAARFGNQGFRDYAAPAFAWLGACRPPLVVAPAGVIGTPFRLAVPNNDMDAVGRAWARNVEPDPQPAELKTLKTVRPTHIVGGEPFSAVHYLWQITDANKSECEKHKETLFAAARSIVALGWGIDMAVGHGQLIDEAAVRELKGERWSPVPDDGGTRLRVPVAGTFDALVARHRDFLGRLTDDGFRPVPPLTAFDTVGYRRDTEPASRPWVAFSILQPDASGNRSFNTPRRCHHVAAWVRCATGKVCEDWPDVATFVHGHDATDTTKQLTGGAADNRFMYLPLPSIERRSGRGTHVGSIRRVLVAAPPGFQDRVDWIRRRLPGQELISVENEQTEVQGLLNLLPTSDWVLRQYTEASRVWSTVTPVLRPGHDDGNAEKAERLLRKAFRDAGLPLALVEGAELEWRSVGFRAGVDLAEHYALPVAVNKYPRYHVRVRWPVPASGPLAVGSGRYRGFGVFVKDDG